MNPKNSFKFPIWIAIYTLSDILNKQEISSANSPKTKIWKVFRTTTFVVWDLNNKNLNEKRILNC
jgi:hypothetical protein